MALMLKWEPSLSLAEPNAHTKGASDALAGLATRPTPRTSPAMRELKMRRFTKTLLPPMLPTIVPKTREVVNVRNRLTVRSTSSTPQQLPTHDGHLQPRQTRHASRGGVEDERPLRKPLG